MSFSLYRKYRPQSFSEVLGQDSIITTLLQQSATRSFAHAYVFTGPRGIGKTTTARLLAKAANCDKPKKNGEPCNSCNSCTTINAGKAIDIIEIDAASHTGVDHVRSVVIDTSRTSPSVLAYKVFIIDEVHMLSSSAFNALLKTLEEPPAHAMFILATTEVHKVPETIISRCQRYAFRRIPVSILRVRLQHIAKLEKITVDDEVLDEIARRADGSSRDAESLLGQLLAFGDSRITKEQAAIVLPRSSFIDVSRFVHIMLQKQTTNALEFINAFVEDGGNSEQFFSDTIAYVRFLILERLGSQKIKDLISAKLPDAARKQLATDATSIDSHDSIRLLEILLRIKKQLWYQEIPELPLELVVCEFCDAETAPNSTASSGAAMPSKTIPSQQAKPSISNLTHKSVSQTSKRNANAAISLTIVKEKWQQFVNEVRKSNPSLSVSMQVSNPIGMNGNSLSVGVPYVFHKERLMQTSIKNYIEEAFEKFYGASITLQVEVTSFETMKASDNLAPTKVKENLWDQIVEAFGEELAPNS